MEIGRRAKVDAADLMADRCRHGIDDTNAAGFAVHGVNDSTRAVGLDQIGFVDTDFLRVGIGEIRRADTPGCVAFGGNRDRPAIGVVVHRAERTLDKTLGGEAAPVGAARHGLELQLGARRALGNQLRARLATPGPAAGR